MTAATSGTSAGIVEPSGPACVGAKLRRVALTSVAWPSQRAADLVQDAQRHHVVPGVASLAAPLVAAGGGDPARPRHPRGAQLADRTRREQAADRGVGEPERCRHDHRHPVGPRRGCRQHRPRLVRVHRHARLDEDVLAGRQRGPGDRGVEVWPGGDDHGVNRRIGDERLPARIRARDRQLGGGAGRGLGGPAHDAHQLHAGERPESRDVPRARDPAGPDEPDADPLRHRPPPCPVSGAGAYPASRSASASAYPGVAPCSSWRKKTNASRPSSRNGSRRAAQASRSAVP